MAAAPAVIIKVRLLYAYNPMSVILCSRKAVSLSLPWRCLFWCTSARPATLCPHENVSWLSREEDRFLCVGEHNWGREGCTPVYIAVSQRWGCTLLHIAVKASAELVAQNGLGGWAGLGLGHELRAL